jgi:hypothetical protein
MEDKHRAGAVLAVIGALYGIFGSFIIFINHWQEMYWAKAAQLRADESVIVKWVIPGLHDLSVVGGVILLVASYLFYKKHKRAWGVAMAGILLMVQGTGFPIVAAASAGIFPKYVFLFVPNMILFFLFITYVRKVDKKLIILLTIVGMAYVLCLFNGIASASRTAMHGGVEGTAAIFVAVQRINWIGVVGWYIFLLGTLLKKIWVHPVGLGAAVLGVLGGVQLGIDSMIMNNSSFSMFLMAPIFCAGLLIYLLLPSGQKLINSWAGTGKARA